jgi:hypothetical protein
MLEIKRTTPATRGFFFYVVIKGRFFCLGNREAALAAAREDGEL